ncbi:MAG TPA: hypothetical protein VMF63_10095 [Opitutaceae bacterium]|nr:hypothetical protein [Opitutaceae bacterium]
MQHDPPISYGKRLSPIAIALLLAIGRAGVSPASGRQSVASPAGVSVSLDEATGRYEIFTRAPEWIFGGEIGRPVKIVAEQRGEDRLGSYQELRFGWEDRVPVSAGIRLYDRKPVVLFEARREKATDEVPAPFPRFTTFPVRLMHFSYSGQRFAPYRYDLEATGTPWLLFDGQGDAVILSPADNFMVSRMEGDGKTEIASGLNDGLTGVPANFAHGTLMAFGHGINATWDTWGRALIDRQGTVRPANNADVGLRYLGYWTDNGATYYYNYDPSLGYAGTLAALVKHERDTGVPIRYLQLDSWWYYKTLTGPDGRSGTPKNPNLPDGEWNRYGGLLKYAAHPAVLPDGLQGFQKRIGLPLITHNRWMDPASPYRLAYEISGYAAIDPRWWDEIMAYLSSGGVTCYEQDWLDVICAHSPALASTVDAGNAFTDNMARAAKMRGISLQYCMAPPCFFLQGSRYDNLTTIRVSDDRFKRTRWDQFLYASRLASAVGIWPWTDVFMSTETDNLRMAVLSGGMVGIGDAIGRENRDNLLQAARPDGVLVKPDASLRPADEMYLAEGRGSKPPMIASTYTDHGGVRTVYVLAYSRSAEGVDTGFSPASFGLAGEVYVYEPASHNATRMSANQRFAFQLGKDTSAYYIIAPVTGMGAAFFGDAGKIVTNGRQRIETVEEQPGCLVIMITFAAGEKSVRLFAYSRTALRAEARSGSVHDATFNAAVGRFEFSASPAGPTVREEPGGDPVQHAEICLYPQ